MNSIRTIGQIVIGFNISQTSKSVSLDAESLHSQTSQLKLQS
jgi:hypothetical protein